MRLRMWSVARAAARIARQAGSLVILAAVSTLAACAMQPAREIPAGTSVVVVPSSIDGHVGAVVVHPLNGGKPVKLDQAYVEANVSEGGRINTGRIDAATTKREFASALAAMPPKPVTFLVFFVEGTDTLQPDAERAIKGVIAAIRSREAPEVAVIGHTDYVGSDEYNDKLSLQRAETARDQLIRRGVPASIISVAGRGKREPIIDTTSAEQQNRRVEITVR